MGLSATRNRFNQAVTTVGRAALNAIYPNDIEYYLFALELVDSNGNTVDYFAFPILPDSISETHQEVTNVKKSLGGVQVLKNSTFVPRDLLLSGTFGKSFKILIEGNPVTFRGIRFSTNSGVFRLTAQGENGPTSVFSTSIKTGYGCIKIIESIKEKSKQLDQNNRPFSLYCYNPIMGNNYQVEILKFSHSQNKDENNQIPNYSIQMRAVAPLESLPDYNRYSGVRNLAFANLQKGINRVARRIRSSIQI